MSLAVVRDLREARDPAGPDEIAASGTDVLAGFVLARAAAGLADQRVSAAGLRPRELSGKLPAHHGAGASVRPVGR